MEAPTRHIFGETTVLFVMATRQEYTLALQKKISALITGVGPIEASAGLAALLGEWKGAKLGVPDLIVALGSAGSPTLDHAGIYQASSVTYRDMDCSPLGFERGVTPFSEHPATLALGPRIPGVKSATLSSGGAIINGAAYEELGADMVDMETYSYAHAARRFGVPLISLRGISDGRDPLMHVDDWTKALEDIGLGLCRAIDLLGEMLESADTPP